MDTFWGYSATAWTAFYTLLTLALVLIAIASALYAKAQWKAAQESIQANRLAEVEANRPYVVVSVELGQTSMQRLDLVVRNVGKRPAVNVRITLDPPPVRAREEEAYAIANMKMLREPIALIAPGQEIRAFYDSATERKDRDDLPSSHKATVAYRDTTGGNWAGEFTLDLEALKGMLFAQIGTVHDLSKSLKEIEKILSRSTLLTHGEIEVEATVESRDDSILRGKKEELERILGYVGLVRQMTPNSSTVSYEQRALQLHEEITLLEAEQRSKRRQRAQRSRWHRRSSVRPRALR